MILKVEDQGMEKEDSSNITWQDNITFPEVGSRHRYPRKLLWYLRKMQRVDRVWSL